MVDKLFNKVFTVMDNSSAVQSVSSLLGGQQDGHIILGANSHKKPLDKTLCIIHKLKKSFFCEDCCFELCVTCKDRHEGGHAVKFIEESAKFVMDKFRDSLEELKELRRKVHNAANQDPSEFTQIEGQINILEQGNKEIDHIFEKIQKCFDQTKAEMKDRLKQAFRANYRATVDKKSQNYFTQLDKLEKYVNACLGDFQTKSDKGKLVVICAQRPKVDELYTNLEKFDSAFERMCEKSREFRNEFQLQFKQTDYENNFKDLLNHHISVTFPGLENGFFPGMKKSLTLAKNNTSEKSDKQNRSLELDSKTGKPMSEFDPLKSLEEEEYDIRKAKDFPVVTPQIQVKPIQVDGRYELRTLKFKKDKFEIKTYDAQNKKGAAINIHIPDEYKRIATRHFSYVGVGKDIIMTGGQFADDKTCSLDSYKILVQDEELVDMNQSLKVARMHHSMIYIEERQYVLAVGGEDENGKLLDSCEVYNIMDNSWKVLNTLNYKGKNIGLCKFIRDNRKAGEKVFFIYAFGNHAIERIDLNKVRLDIKWEEVNVKNFTPVNIAAITFQFDDNLIIICGGIDDKNSNAQDVILFNQSVNVMEKSTATQLSVCDKFIGGSQTQFVINRIDSKILFCSEAFVHEMEYGSKAGDALFKFKANLY